MEETGNIDNKAKNSALKYLASYVASIAILIASVLFVLNAAQSIGVDQELIRKINIATPVVAIVLSLLIHFLVKHKIKKALIIAISIFALSFASAVISMS